MSPFWDTPFVIHDISSFTTAGAASNEMPTSEIAALQAS
jgi:hypothetical protein